MFAELNLSFVYYFPYLFFLGDDDVLNNVVLYFNMFIRLLFLSILITNICRYFFVLRLNFVLHVFTSFMVYYEEVELPLYVKGCSDGVTSFKVPLRKVRLLCYRFYLVHHELMHVFIFLCR